MAEEQDEREDLGSAIRGERYDAMDKLREKMSKKGSGKTKEEIVTAIKNLNSTTSRNREEAIDTLVEEFNREGSNKEGIFDGMVAMLRPKEKEDKVMHDHIRADIAGGLMKIIEKSPDEAKDIVDQSNLEDVVKEAKEITTSKSHLSSIEDLEERVERL